MLNKKYCFHCEKLFKKSTKIKYLSIIAVAYLPNQCVKLIFRYHPSIPFVYFWPYFCLLLQQISCLLSRSLSDRHKASPHPSLRATGRLLLLFFQPPGICLFLWRLRPTSALFSGIAPTYLRTFKWEDFHVTEYRLCLFVFIIGY